MFLCFALSEGGKTGFFTHTGDGGEDFRYSETKSDVADLVSWNTSIQEDVEGEGADLGRRKVP